MERVPGRLRPRRLRVAVARDGAADLYARRRDDDDSAAISRAEPRRLPRRVTSGTDGTPPYPAGTVGTPGPLDGYCGTGDQAAESAAARSRQPAGTTLPLAPAYFPHIVRNADGSLTGYFDYRPKDADEAIVAAHLDRQRPVDWTYEGEALEQNPGYCPSADINDDGEGHPNVITVGGEHAPLHVAARGRRQAGRRHARAPAQPDRRRTR